MSFARRSVGHGGAKAWKSSDGDDAAGLVERGELQQTRSDVWSICEAEAPAAHFTSFETQSLSNSSPPNSILAIPTSSCGSDSEFEIIDKQDIVDSQTQTDSRELQASTAARAAAATKWDPSTLLPSLSQKRETKARDSGQRSARLPGARNMDAGPSNDYADTDWQQAGKNATEQDLAGPGREGELKCRVDKPQREAEGTQNAYISYLVTTDTDFKSFQSSHSSARRRFTDFVFLYKTLQREYPQCAVPPLPDKHNMSYVRGDRFAPDFTSRRAHSLDRFLKRLAMHPVLRRAVILTLFLESSDWNATMRSRPQRGMSGAAEPATSSVLETWTDSFLNAFAKPHKTDKRFADVNDRASKLDEDLGTVSKTVARVAKREADLETDYADLATQFQKLAALEPGVNDELTKFATSVQDTSAGWKDLKEHTDQSYLGSLKDMEAYILAVKSLLKTREQKQLDFEGLTEYLSKAQYERDTLASHGGNTGATGFFRQKIEDVRGVDHEQSRRERQRKLEVQISRLQTEVESSKKTSEAFDEEVVKEVQDFERIKAHEFRDTLGGLAEAHIAFFQGNIEIWERFVKDMEKLEAEGRGEGGVQ